MKNTFLLFAVLFLQTTLWGQSTQTIKGTITDKQSQETIIGATVRVLSEAGEKAAVTDEEGRYKIENLAPGRYEMSVSFPGYKPFSAGNIIVTTGKEVVMDIQIEESVNAVEEVVVTAKKNEMNNELISVSGRSFSMEEVNRYAGGRSDPARMAANFAGVSSPDDSRNDLVIRGNSPVGVLWRIEGLNIGNPNHFSTIGTTGGPVSAINTNLLRNSDFMTSAFPAEYGNANAGVFDLGFRNGNTEKREHMFQFGALTGLEFATEGYFKKGSGASYVFAYRYGFASVAQQLGLSVGTAATPYYQDISFKINSKMTKAGKFTLFGLGAESHIDFLHTEIDSTDLFADPSKDSYFRSKIGVIGLKHNIRINGNSYVQTVIGTTFAGSKYLQDRVITTGLENEIVNNTQRINYTINTAYNNKISPRLFIKTGVIAELLTTDLFYTNRVNQANFDTLWNTLNTATLFQGYFHAKYSFTDQLTMNIGLHSQLLSLNNKATLEPRFGLKYQTKKSGTINVGYGLHSQMQPTDIYFLKTPDSFGNYVESNKKLDFTKSHHTVLGYEISPIKDWKFKTEVYYQYIYNAPVDSFASSYSMLNAGASFFPNNNGNLQNKGTGENYGFELTVEKLFSKGYYGMFSGSIYNSTYKGSDGVSRNTAFNGNYVYNVLIGKEFKIGSNKQNAIKLDVKFTHAGGRYYTPVDLALSQLAQTQVVKGDEFAFTEKYSDFARLDVKIGYVHNSKKLKISQSWSFDVNNVTNRKNIFAERYNPVNNSLNTSYQIGFFPNFVYRLEF